MARQYFTSQPVDAAVAASSITPGTTKTFIFTQNQSLLYFPMPFGASAPSVGQGFYFKMGGLITTPATGTLIIDPTFGNGTSTTAGGTSMGASPAQTVTASLSNIPWLLEGAIVFRSISATATTSTAWLTGAFQSQGTLATAGGGWGMTFGSTAAVSVDTTGLGSAGTFGGLNFYVTFSVTGATISAQWTILQSNN